MEVLVVDNHSQDGSAEAVSSLCPEVILLAESQNHGYAKGNNLGISQAKGEFILTLNPDTEMLPNTLESALAFMNSHPDCGAIGAKQIGMDGNVQKSIRGFPTVSGVFYDAIGLAKRFPNSLFDSYRCFGFNYNREQLAPQPMGTFLMFRKSALAEVNTTNGPFDESFPIFFNEVDLLFRIQQRGWQCWYLPSVEIRHYGGESTKLVRKSIIWESHKSLLRYWKKHAHGVFDFLALGCATIPVYGLAFVRAKGYDKGFQPDGYNLQLEHTQPNPPLP